MRKKGFDVFRKFYIYIIFIIANVCFSQTVIIGNSTIQRSDGPISLPVTGTPNHSYSVNLIKAANLNSMGIGSGAKINEWGYKKISTTQLFDASNWRIKVYLMNTNYASVNNQSFQSIKSGATLVYESIINKSNFPVQECYWMWQLQTPFYYGSEDIACIVEFENLNRNLYNISKSMLWEGTSDSGVYISGRTSINPPYLVYDNISLSSGLKTRISYTRGNFNGTLSSGIISSSVQNANAGAPFVLVGSNLSHGNNILYQWQKFNTNLNQWENIGNQSIYPTLSNVLQNFSTDYRLITISTSTSLIAYSNIISVGQNQNVNFIDPFFKFDLLTKISSTQAISNALDQYINADTNDDGEIQLSEAQIINKINLRMGLVGFTGLNDLVNFNNLKTFNAGYRTDLLNINIPNVVSLEHLSLYRVSLSNITFSNSLPSLKSLDLRENNLSNINLSLVPNLTTLSLDKNAINNIDVSNLSLLSSFSILQNQLTSLTCNSSNSLTYLNCGYNSLTSLSIQSNYDSFNLKCDHNLLSNLDLNNINQFYSIDCSFNRLTNLDISNKRNLMVNIKNNELVTIILKNNSTENIDFSFNPNLRYICADYNEINTYRNLAFSYGLTNINVNEYCSFDPIGNSNILNVQSRYNILNQNCDISSPKFPFLKLNLNDNSDASSPYVLENYYTNYLGNLNQQISSNYMYIPMFVEPVIENSNYFTITPARFDFELNNQQTLFNSQFCITPNGIHQDVEIVIVPVGDARPGLEAQYRIVLLNKGTENSNGDINLTFDISKLSYLESDMTPILIDNNLIKWNYSNLSPFETKSILVKFNVRMPGIVNNGDYLNFNSNVLTSTIDENYNNNTSVLQHKVINSHDPNNIICIEGNNISSDYIGKYVHYLINFENIGTANAINVVVKNLIDSSKFDLNTLHIIGSSHGCSVRQRNDVFEFIFENINLPFDDANNDGYILFKIKLLDSLDNSDVFENQAEIYFDYNFPILTNNEVTSFSTLSLHGNILDNLFRLFPNPTNAILNFESNQEIKSLELYDLQGRLLKRINDTSKYKFDLSNEAKGIYFIKITTEKGSFIEKIIKN